MKRNIFSHILRYMAFYILSLAGVIMTPATLNFAYATPEAENTSRDIASITPDNLEYAQLINAYGRSIMAWYDLVSQKQKRETLCSPQQSSHAIKLLVSLHKNAKWACDQLKNYPNTLSNIQITSAQLTYTDKKQLQFSVHATAQANQYKSYFNDTFIFNPVDTMHTDVEIVKLHHTLKEKVVSDTPQNTAPNNELAIKAQAYEWMAQLNGITLTPSLLSNKKAIQLTTTIAGEKHTGDSKTLLKKRTIMGPGYSLLRNITITPHKQDPNLFYATLIIDWKGTASDNTPALAKIKHLITFRHIKENTLHSIELLEVQESFLLPDIEPWNQLLC